MKHKTQWNTRILNKFKLPSNSKITYYRNPKEFCYMELERINPNHIINLLGIERRKKAKYKPRNKIRLGKILIPSLIFLNISTINIISFYLISQIIYSLICSLLLYHFCVDNKCLIKIYHYLNYQLKQSLSYC